MTKNLTSKLLMVFIAGLLSFNTQAQGMKERAADKLYDNLAYAKASEMYAELAKKDDATEHQLRRAAESYRLIGETVKSEKWYKKLSTNSGAKAADFYYYAQMLKMNEKYDEANKMMAKVAGMKPDNTVASSHSKYAGYSKELKSIPNKYNIALFEVNSKTSDFAPSYYTVDGVTSVVFASARTENTSLVGNKFQWDGSNFLDAYIANVGVDGEKVKVERFDRGIKSKYHEGPAAFSNNGSIMYLTRSNYLNRKKGLDSARHNNLKLYISEKDSNGKWGDLKEFTHNSDDYSVGHASVTEDGETMYFTSDMPGSMGETDIWMSKKEGSKWGKPMNVKELNSEGKEMFPFIANDGTLYFSTDGFAGLGGQDVFRALGSKDGSFGTPENMMYPLNTSSDDFGLIMDLTGKEGYFSSNRKSGDAKGSDDIYRFKMLVPFQPKSYTVKGCVKSQTEEVVANSTVKLIDNATGAVIKQTLATNGCFEFKDLKPGSYKIEGTKSSWEKVSDFELNTKDYGTSEINDANVYLKKPDCSLLGTIIDAETGDPMADVNVSITDKKTGKVSNYVTNGNGEFMGGLEGVDCPGGTLNYEMKISKEGYFDKKMNFKKTIKKAGVVNVMDDLSSIKLQKSDGDVSKYCEINEILYDFNKSNIRPDAATELDKLVSCMKEHPEMRIEIGSHTDCRGSERYNEKLSDRRAKSARSYVISKGIDASRIFGKGYGETKLLNGCACEGKVKSNCSDEEHQMNRRTEFKIVSGGSSVKNKSSNSF